MLGYFFQFSRPLSCIALSNSILKKNTWSAARFYQKLSRTKENLFLPGNCSMSKVTGCYTAGSATPMIDVSIMIRNWASESNASAFHRRGSCVTVIDSCLCLLLLPISCSLVVFVVVVFMAFNSMNSYIAT
jgi:hypothetical protein